MQSERYLLACMRYVELNPVRANMVKVPDEYRWSSYQANALGGEDRMVTPHDEYLALGATPEARYQAYRSLFETEADDLAWTQIRAATQQGVIVADSQFAEAIARRIGHAAQLRPRVREMGSDSTYCHFPPLWRHRFSA